MYDVLINNVFKVLFPSIDEKNIAFKGFFQFGDWFSPTISNYYPFGRYFFGPPKTPTAEHFLQCFTGCTWNEKKKTIDIVV